MICFFFLIIQFLSFAVKKINNCGLRKLSCNLDKVSERISKLNRYVRYLNSDWGNKFNFFFHFFAYATRSMTMMMKREKNTAVCMHHARFVNTCNIALSSSLLLHRRVRGSVAAIRIYVSSSSSSSVKVVCEWNALRCAAIIVVYTFLSPLLSFFFFFYSISSFFQTPNLNALFVAFFLPLILTFIWFYFIDDAVKELPENLNMFSCNNDYDEA